MFTLKNQGIVAPSSRRSRYLLPPEELLEEVVRLRLSAPISLLTRVRRSVDMLFLEEIFKHKIYQLQRKQAFIWSWQTMTAEATRCKIEEKKQLYSSFNGILHRWYLLMDCAVSFLGEEGEERRRFC